MRRPRLAGIWLVAVAALGAGAAVAGVKDDDNLNYELRVPEDWAWTNVAPFEKQSVVAGADRRLTTLADGQPAKGEGGRVLLAIQDPPKEFPTEDYERWLYDWQQLELQAKEKDPVPEAMVQQIDALREKMEKALADLASRSDVRSLLLERFGKDPAQWPAAETDARGIDVQTIPAARVAAEGECPNHEGVKAKCQASMHVWVLRKRMYRLAVWIWPTARDREHLRDQRDEIELSMDMKKKEAIAPKAAPPRPDPSGANGGGPAPAAGAREDVKDLAMGFEVVKPARLKAQEIDRSNPSERDTAFRFSAESQGDRITLEMFSYRIGTAGATGFDLREYFSGLWASFLKTHPAGDLTTSPFAPVTPRNPFLTLPDLAKKKAVDRPADPKDKPSLADLERLGLLQEVKNASIGKVKVQHAWRLLLKGNVERIGDEWWLVYTFSTDARAYAVRIIAQKGGWTTWKDDVVEVLRSLALIEEK